jgi:HAD superfamily hydrolase (TIGR01509 family)
MIKAIIFDMGNVLVNFDHPKAAKQIAAICDTTSEDVWNFLFASGLEMKYEAGEVATQEIHAMIEKKYGKKIALDRLIHAVSDIFSPKLEMLPVLKSLKSQGYRLQILSNTNVLHWQFCKKNFEFIRYFDAFTLSFEVKAVKPDAEIYADAVKKSGFKAEECFYTDDVAAYAAAAVGNGLRGFQFIDVEKLRNDLESVGVKV